jgi:colanic acid/amylovoran biosynthesis protein
LKFSQILTIKKRKFNFSNFILFVGVVILVGISIGISFIYRYSKGKKNVSMKSGAGNVIVIATGGYNKGGQAMTFTVVDQLQRRFPHKNIYLFPRADFQRKIKDMGYRFEILPWHPETRMKFLLFGFWNQLIFKKNDNSSKHNLVLKNTDFFVDISGHDLSSQWNNFLRSVIYMLNIMIAHKYSIPYYIFPQTIGPFEYYIHHKIFLYPLFRLYFKYPMKIFPRESEGLNYLRCFTGSNVEKRHDVVFQNEGYNLSNIYSDENIQLEIIQIDQNSVGIMPSIRIFERTTPEKFYEIYEVLINRLIDSKKIVYIMRHAFEDLEVCKNIKKRFSSNKDVRFIPDDLNCIEIENIVKQFKIVIASRYHAIVHSYKNGVPVLAIGWATKYFELLKAFGQQDYLFDVRNAIEIDEINDKLEKLLYNCNQERERILKKLRQILNRGSIFDIFLHIDKTDNGKCVNS